MASALTEDPSHNLMLAPVFVNHLKTHHTALRRVVAAAVLTGHAVPALSARLAWFDLPRDFFSICAESPAH